MDKRITNSLQETQMLALEFAKKLKGGDVVALYGNLGAGKTTFVQGLAEGLEIDHRLISPTFVIVRTYDLENNNAGIKKFYHIDLYRLESEKDFGAIGLREILQDKESIIAIEWAEKLGSLLPKNRWEVHLNHLEGDKREISIKQIL